MPEVYQEKWARSGQAGSDEPGIFGPVVYGMFFLSGLASLICEVVWFKQFQHLIGGTTFAISVVVASFFAGLSGGAWLAGRWADRRRRLLLVYGLLELALCGLSAAVTTGLADWQLWVGPLLPWLGGGPQLARPVMAGVSLLILLPPTLLMGATLPVLARHMVRERSRVAERLGLLYGLNTLGAAAGTLLAGFVLIEKMGVREAAYVAAMLYGAIGGLAIFLALSGPQSKSRPKSKKTPGTAAVAVTVTVAVARERTEIEPGQVAPRALALAFAVTGFTAIAYEVLWFRLLTYFTLSTVYAFAAMLSVFLLGLVLGSFICARYLARHKDRLLLYAARIQLATAASAMVSIAILGRSRTFLEWFREGWQTLGLTGAAQSDAMVMGLAFISLILPTTVIGLMFPLTGELITTHMGRLGGRVGLLYGLNTLGGVLGSIAAGFVLLPLFGAQASFAVVIGLNLAVYFLLVSSQPGLRGNRLIRREGFSTAIMLAAAWVALGGDYLRHAQTRFTGATVLAFREDADGTFTTLGYQSAHAGRFQQLLVNGRSYANNSPPGRRYMSVLGHLPALLHPDPRRAAVVAIGTGTTVGSLTLHPELEEIWAVDISRNVFDMADHFSPLNNDFLKSPKVRAVVADGRHFLMVTERKFDILTFEPPPPVETGVVNLYSREFYELAKARLAEGGILCQWIPLGMDREVLGRMLIKTVLAAFPHVSLWIPAQDEGVVIASLEPIVLDEARLRARMARAELQRDMSAYGLGRPEQLLATFVTADDALARFAGDAPVVTDNRPRVEYFNAYPRRRFRFSDLDPFKGDVATIMAAPPVDRAKLATARQVVKLLRDAWQAGSRVQAGGALDQALALDPQNPYLKFRRRDLAVIWP